MKRPKLPIPGIVLGSCPERKELPQAKSFPAIPGVLPARAYWRQHKLNRATQRILRLFATLRQRPGGASPARLLPLRAALRRDGFVSATGEHCIAAVLLAIEGTLGFTLRPHQIMAAQAILHGMLAEVPTGEGKTLATILAASVAALAGVPVHVITSNDYLAGRDAKKMQALAARLGITISAIDPDMDVDARRCAYAADITYCSAKELVFDYLRDGLAPKPDPGGQPQASQRVLRGLCMAIIDEADSVLIDEAATPFILSKMDADPTLSAVCELAMSRARSMQSGFDFRIDHRNRKIVFTPDGLKLLADVQENAPAIWSIPKYREEMVELALYALHVLKANEDYLVKDDKIAIIDNNSGRLAEGRSWSKGLHQLVEIKERSSATPPTQVLAQISFQRFFPRYLLLAGTSGTLTEARRELLETYGLHVQRIPTGRSQSLKIKRPVVATTAARRWRHVIAEIVIHHHQGRPVLVGTDSVRESERISKLLHQAGLPHRVLNARHDAEEASLIAAAGKTGAITVTTNMAGRGTDIVLDESAVEAGGLHVVSCQHNSSKRIDRQLFGRAGRAGQPGSAHAILSLEEGLLGRSLPGRVKNVLGMLANRHGFLPSPVAKLIIQYTQSRSENQSRVARLRLRETEENQRKFQLFGTQME